MFWCQLISVQLRARLLKNVLSLVLHVLSIFAITMFLLWLIKALFDKFLASFWSTKKYFRDCWVLSFGLRLKKTELKSEKSTSDEKEKSKKISSKREKLRISKTMISSFPMRNCKILFVDWENVLWPKDPQETGN